MNLLFAEQADQNVSRKYFVICFVSQLRGLCFMPAAPLFVLQLYQKYHVYQKGRKVSEGGGKCKGRKKAINHTDTDFANVCF